MLAKLLVIIKKWASTTTTGTPLERGDEGYPDKFNEGY